MNNVLKLAEHTVSELKKTRNERFYPNVHLAPEAGWINDPNGIIFFDNKYHVFFQHHPFDANWGSMHWGHVSSPDLITWDREPIALAPGESYDSGGCFSGSAVVDENGELVLIYTGHVWLGDIGDMSNIKEYQCVAKSKDGKTFTKHGIVISPLENITHFRDPKVFKHKNVWYLVLGVQTEKRVGEVWLYRSDDLMNWDFEQVLYQSKNEHCTMIECPDFFELDGKWVLIGCPMGIKPVGYQYRNINQCCYLVGEWSPGQSFNYSGDDWVELDLGHDFYAIQSCIAHDNRRIAIAWLCSWKKTLDFPVSPAQQSDGWNAQLSLFRELSLLGQEKIIMKPVSELKDLRQDEQEYRAIRLYDEEALFDISSVTCEIELKIDLSKNQADRYGIAVAVTSNNEETRIMIDNQSRRIVLDRTTSGIGSKGYRSVSFDNLSNELILTIFVDKSSVELFVNRGVFSLSSTIFPTDSTRKIKLFSENGDADFESMKVWQLKNIYRK